MTQAITPTRKRLTIIIPIEPDSDNVKGPVTKPGYEDKFNAHKTFKYLMKPLFNDYVLDFRSFTYISTLWRDSVGVWAMVKLYGCQ